MNDFWKSIENVQDKMKVIGAACLVGMTFLTCINVVGRLFNHPVFGTEELVAFLATFAVAFSLPYAHKEDAHIGVEIVLRLFSQKTQSIVTVITKIVSFFLFIIVTWRMFVYASSMKASGEVSMNLELPEYYVIYVLSFCFLVLTLFVLKDIILFFKNREQNK